MKAAIEALPYQRPRLAVTAMVNGEDFASLLERSIERSRYAPSFKAIDYASAPAAQGDDEHS
jgi:hypothetical protein